MSRVCTLGLVCGGGCELCGWNPEVISERKARIRRGEMRRYYTKDAQERRALFVPFVPSAVQSRPRVDVIREQIEEFLHAEDGRKGTEIHTDDPPEISATEIANSVRKVIKNDGYGALLRCSVHGDKVRCSVHGDKVFILWKT